MIESDSRQTILDNDLMTPTLACFEDTEKEGKAWSTLIQPFNKRTPQQHRYGGKMKSQLYPNKEEIRDEWAAQQMYKSCLTESSITKLTSSTAPTVSHRRGL